MTVADLQGVVDETSASSGRFTLTIDPADLGVPAVGGDITTSVTVEGAWDEASGSFSYQPTSEGVALPAVVFTDDEILLRLDGDWYRIDPEAFASPPGDPARERRHRDRFHRGPDRRPRRRLTG